MSNSEDTRISKSMTFLLRHRPEVGNLTLDANGWVSIAELCRPLSKQLNLDITPDRIRTIVRSAELKRFEISGETIRARRRSSKNGMTRVSPPDILYFPTTQTVMKQLEKQDRLVPSKGRFIDLYNEESEAWRLAHRLGHEPAVLYVDAARATRFGGRFYRNARTGTFHAHRVQIRDILNLQAQFAHQYSAGGVPLRWDKGAPQLLLCKVKRRSGVTWEVAKGKLEPCETPEQAAIREVHEELGFELPLYTREHVGDIRYGFIAPGGLPRLKTVHMYLLESNDSWEGIEFEPATAEGIIDVRWFSPVEAASVVKHSSLIPIMRRVRDILERAYNDNAP